MKKLIFFILLGIAIQSKAQIAPADFITLSRPLYKTGSGIDSRSRIIDKTVTPNLVRDYISIAEALTYLANSSPTVQAQIRTGPFDVYINTSGTLSAGVITGGTRLIYWFKDGVADANLILKVPYTGAFSQLTGGDGTPITLGTNLSLSGTTLNATGGGGGGTGTPFSIPYYNSAGNYTTNINNISLTATGMGIGTQTPNGPLSVTPFQYSTGTASQSGTTITGSGTIFIGAMTGSQIVFSNGTSATITFVNTATQLTVTPAQTVASQTFIISYPGLQVLPTGHLSINTTNQMYTGYASNSNSFTYPASLSVNGPASIEYTGNVADALMVKSNGIDNVMAIWNTIPTGDGYSAIRYLGPTGFEMAANGFAPPGSSGPFAEPGYGSAFLEASNFLTPTNYGSYRFVQTKPSVGSFLREEYTHDGTHNWYDLAYPTPNVVMSMSTTGTVSMTGATSALSYTTTNGGFNQTGTANNIFPGKLNVGSTATPGSALSVHGTDGDGISFYTGATQTFQGSYLGVGIIGMLSNHPQSFYTNGTEKARITTSGNFLIATAFDSGDALNVNGSIRSTQYKLPALNTAPVSATDTGTIGEIRITSTFIYVCTATNTWVRTALTTW
jgi:hypothetical protein